MRSKIQLTADLLGKSGQTNQTPILYNKTVKEFKATYGIELSGAPCVFKKHGSLYELTHRTYKFRGRTYEKAEYLPMVDVGVMFDELLREDIYTNVDAFNEKMTKPV